MNAIEFFRKYIIYIKYVYKGDKIKVDIRIFERNINYYETDRMGVVHHSNYIRYLEEARTFWLNEIGVPFDELEKRGVTVPVLGVNCEYKYHVTFGDTILINTFIKEYNGVRMTVRI